jgi:restriction endonuclease S subunit
MKRMVRKGALEQVRFILPPQDQREKFAGIFRKIMALTEKLERSASEANALYGSLAQRAFQGKL